MIRRWLILLLVLGLGLIFAPLLINYTPTTELNPLARYYAEHTAQDLGAANIVTAIIVTYRGLDTLGEVTVLFLTSAIIGMFLANRQASAQTGRRQVQAPIGELLETATRLLVPLILLLGVYVFINGHLTPGGGFQGGAILASAALLILLSNPARHLSHRVISAVESISGVVFVLLGIFGLLWAGGFLDARIFPTGSLGSIFSAGAIPLIYSFIGLKVGAEFTSMLTHLAEESEKS